MSGHGLNSLRSHVTLLMGGFVFLTIFTVFFLDQRHALLNAPLGDSVPPLALVVLLAMTATYVLTGRFTDSIEKLRQSTEAATMGDLEEALNVECKAEIGELADSFRMMVRRFNANLVKINTLAYTDALTRLPNRSVLNHALELAMSARYEARMAGAVMFIDLDNFKNVNDSLGHDAGDELLLAAVNRILAKGLGCTRDNLAQCTGKLGELRNARPDKPLFTRFAGDEFVLLLPEVIETEELKRIGNAIVDALLEPFLIKGSQVKIGASIGIAILQKDSGSAVDILSCADLAMYAAKQSGRNRISFYNAMMGETAAERSRIESELRSAIGAGELRAVFQPKVETKTLKLASLEALVRWQHPTRGLLEPSVFISIAEQTGLIDQLGQEVLRISARQCAEWLAQGVERRISVNVCHTQFLRPDFAERVLATIAEHNMPCHLLELEVTETIALANPQLAISHLETLRNAGVSIAVDDFGVGYSNLCLLASLPLDTLKIDRSLICGIGLDPKREQIVAAIIEMARAMGHTTVAEGVETLQQYEFLLARGCDEVQGFLVARPMSPDNLSRWLRDHFQPWKHPSVRQIGSEARALRGVA